MKFKFYNQPELPKLAWCAVVTHESNEINIYHGNGVETSEDFFFEGAWDGDCHSAEFEQSILFMGSGGKNVKTESGRVLFATSNHTLERLYSIIEKNIVFISNSLPFILYMSESELDLNYIDYETDFNSVLKGVNNYTRVLPLNKGKKIRIHYYCNIILNLNNEIEILETTKNEVIPFNNYVDYEERLFNTLIRFVANAQSLDRKNKYGLVTTISKGYDAAACAAIAMDVGCEKVVSFNRPKKYEDDCGRDIAEKLGYKKIITKNADDYKNNISLVEAEFVSSGELGTGIVFTAFEKEFENNIVFIGERGDKIWDKNRTDSNKEMRFENEVFSGTSLIENRLKVGYILLPLPLFGASQWPSIHEISNSIEMQRYSIGGSYDRPIPRRILETRGIDREMFGVRKKGAGFNYRFDNLSRIRKRMSKESFKSFYKFYINHKRKMDLNVLGSWFKFLWYSKSLYLNYFLKKMHFNVKSEALTADSYSNPGAPSYLFNWGVNEIIKRYEKAMIEKWWIKPY